MWWLHLSKQLEDLIQKCPVCCKEQLQSMEPLIVSELPGRPWYKVATDLFQWKGASYLIIVYYFSHYIEIARLANESAGEVVRHTKSIFAWHGIPEIVVSDNGPQLTFKDFANKYEFIHHTSSPYHPQGNGEAERAVRTIKSLLRKAEDPYLALLSYCATPVAGLGFISLAELLMSRMLRTTVPLCHSCLQPIGFPIFLLFLVEMASKRRAKRKPSIGDTEPIP